MVNGLQLLIAKKKKQQKNDLTHCCKKITSEKNLKQGSKKIQCYSRLCHTDKCKGAFKNEKSDSFKNNFLQISVAAKCVRTKTKKD